MWRGGVGETYLSEASPCFRFHTTVQRSLDMKKMEESLGREYSEETPARNRCRRNQFGISFRNGYLLPFGLADRRCPPHIGNVRLFGMKPGRVSSCVSLFEACSAFTHVTACRFA
jgi:hypothetical protein